MIRALASALVAHPWLGVLLVALPTLLAVPQLADLEVDNALEVWLPPSGAEQRRYQEFVREFGSEEYVLVIYPLGLPLEEGFLERLVDLRFELEEIEGVAGVYDLSGIYSRFYALLGRERFERDLATPFYSRFLVSEDRELAATWVLLDLASDVGRESVVDGIRAGVERAGLESFWLAGSPVLNQALDDSSTGAARRFFPLVFLVSCLLLLGVFKRFAGIVIPVVSVGCGLIWTMALLVVQGDSLDMVTVTLPPVLWVVGLATSIHLLARSQARLRGGDDVEPALTDTLTELIPPCVMSAVTTAIGFGALTVSSMRPVEAMGRYAALGVFCCLASNLLLFPSLGRWWGRHGGRWSETSSVARRLEWVGAAVVARPRTIVAVSAALVVVAVFGLIRLEADSNVIEFFADDTRIATTYEEVVPAITGPYSLEVLLEPPEGVRSLPTLERIDRLSEELGDLTGVARVLSVVDFVKKASMATEDPSAPYDLPADEEALAVAWDRVDRHLADEVGSLVGSQGTVRLSVIARPMGSTAHGRLVERLEEVLDRDELSAWKPRVTGVVTLLVELQDELLRSQIRSFGLAFLLIVPLILVFFRSPAYAAASLPPNLVPIVLVLGSMGYVGIPLDPATVMIAAIALGLAVDDTIHFLGHYRRLRRDGAAVERAAVDTLVAVGRALWITTAVVAAGFSMLCFSSFRPLLFFGLLSAVTAVAALVGNLVLLPAVLMLPRSAKVDG